MIDQRTSPKSRGGRKPASGQGNQLSTCTRPCTVCPTYTPLLHVKCTERAHKANTMSLYSIKALCTLQLCSPTVVTSLASLLLRHLLLCATPLHVQQVTSTCTVQEVTTSMKTAVCLVWVAAVTRERAELPTCPCEQGGRRGDTTSRTHRC